MVGPLPIMELSFKSMIYSLHNLHGNCIILNPWFTHYMIYMVIVLILIPWFSHYVIYMVIVLI